MLYDLKIMMLVTTGLFFSPSSFAISTADINQGITSNRLVAELIDTSKSNITYRNIKYTGTNNAAGLFLGGLADGLGINQGLILSSGRIANAIGPNKCYKTTTVNRQSGDINLNTLGGYTLDAAVLEFDFVPDGDTLEFNYVFASEEYNEWVGSKFNDVFGFFLDGRNIALIPNTLTSVAINSINPNSNSQYYRDNHYPHPNSIVAYNNEPCKAGISTPFLTEFDGFTTILTATAKVIPGRTHHIKLAVADRGDYSLDSAVFIQGKSFATILPPPAAFLIAPTGASDNTPTYTWQAVSTATDYQLVVKNAHGQVILNQRYTAAEAHCGSGTGTCSTTPTLELADGAYQWQIQPINSSGNGPWSTAMTFSVQTAPDKVTLISPTGTLNYNNSLSYSWNAVPTATQYQLQIKDARGLMIEQTYSAAEAGCANGTDICSITLDDIPLAEGAAQWWIQTVNNSGKGPLSDGMVFTIELPPPPVVTKCQLYAVHDEGLNDSRFFVVDKDTVTTQGTNYVAHDFEALDYHQVKAQFYTASGKDANSEAGTLYEVNANGIIMEKRRLTLDNGSKIKDISGLSVHPQNNVLWGWAQGQGLFRFEVEAESSVVQLKMSSTKKMNDLSWNVDGSALYLAKKHQLLQYDGTTLTPVCTLSKGQKMEALETTPEGLLLIGLHGNNVVYQLDLNNDLMNSPVCPIEPFELPPIPYEDIEGMTWVCTTK
jgi:hypothetical protein